MYIYPYPSISVHRYRHIHVWWAPWQTHSLSHLSLSHTIPHFLLFSLSPSLFYVYTCVHVYTYIYWQTSWVSMCVCDKISSFFLTPSVFRPLAVPPSFCLVLCIHTYICITYTYMHTCWMSPRVGNTIFPLTPSLPSCSVSLPYLCLAHFLSFSMHTNIYTYIHPYIYMWIWTYI